MPETTPQPRLASGKTICDPDHLVLQIDRHICPCGASAARLMRCRSCKGVIARCTQHSATMSLDHERACTP